jgi:hypothetical protein
VHAQRADREVEHGPQARAMLIENGKQLVAIAPAPPARVAPDQNPRRHVGC